MRLLHQFAMQRPRQANTRIIRLTYLQTITPRHALTASAMTRDPRGHDRDLHSQRATAERKAAAQRAYVAAVSAPTEFSPLIQEFLDECDYSK